MDVDIESVHLKAKDNLKNWEKNSKCLKTIVMPKRHILG